MASSAKERGSEEPRLFDRETFQRRLRDRMFELQLKGGSDLARKTGISQPQCSRLLSDDDFREPLAETLLRLAVRLDISLDRLLAVTEVAARHRSPSEPPPSATRPSTRPA